MNKIKTYKDLLEEKKQLETQLESQRAQIRADVTQLKEDWKPFADLVSGLGKNQMTGRINPLLSLGIDLIGNALIRNVLPARGGWIARALLPMLAKGFSTHILNKEGTSVFRQLFHRFSRREPNGTPSYADASAGTPSYADASAGTPSYADASAGTPSYADASAGTPLIESK